MPPGSEPARVLVAVLVYNGRDFVPHCLESVRHLLKGSSNVDILVLDDASPDDGWSEELAALTGTLGFQYYRSPRNLGIPRNMNLALLWAVEHRYEYVLILNSDVVVPHNLVDGLVAVARTNVQVASVTAWSNSCSIYSLPNADPAQFLAAQEDVESSTEVLSEWAGTSGVPIPVGVGFCLLLPVPAVQDVGLFDPIFGRGYCEENDWCLRAKEAGLKNVLAMNVFAYHMGGASTRDAGLVAPGETTVAAHERIIDWRYPSYRRDVAEFERSGVIQHKIREALRHLVRSAAERLGYAIYLTSLPVPAHAQHQVDVRIQPEGQDLIGYFRGFQATFELDPNKTVIENATALFGRPPHHAEIAARGPYVDQFSNEARESELDVVFKNPYPERI